MNTSSIGFFLPIRAGSQRVPHKNTKPFGGLEGGLVELKLRQLMQSEGFDEIVLSTDDEEAISVAHRLDPAGERIRVIRRPQELCLGSTPVSELIAYVPTVMSTQHIFWGHATAPFASAAVYAKAMEQYRTVLDEGYDSLLTVSRLQAHILDPQTARVINTTVPGDEWPRTQDMPLWYEVNHAFYIAPREIYLKFENRIGKVPFMYELSKIESFDIDWEEDFLMAEAIYEKLYA